MSRPRRSSPSPSRNRRRHQPSARRVALAGLVAVERADCIRDGGKRDGGKRLRDELQLDGLAPRDRDLAWELAQGTERAHLFLDFVLLQFVTRRLPEAALLRSVLRLGAYQLLLLTRIPNRAAVNETVELLRDNRGFVNAVLRKVADHICARAADPSLPCREFVLPADGDGPRCLVFDRNVVRPANVAGQLAARYGIPEFLARRWVECHGFDAATKICAASSGRPSVFLRATPRVPEGRSLVEVLAVESVTVEAFAGPMFRVLSGSPFTTRAFAEGLFIAQDPTAHAAAMAVDAQPGETVFDLCAAPGTKTTVLAEAVGTNGTVFAWDIHRFKLDSIRENATRLGLADRIRYPESFELERPVDRVLADVPCSNTGVLARRVEARRRLAEQTFRELAVVQRECLARAVAACRIGGVVVYSTCSIEPEENREVVESVLDGRCELVTETLTLPDPDGGDGGYFAVLTRKGG